jgi:hypothetical protein
VITAADVGQLADEAFAEAERHPARSAERRAASHLWVACTVPPARSVASARKAIASFGDERTQAGALALLSKIATTGETS